MSEPIEVFSMPHDVRSNPYFALWRAALEKRASEAVLREVPKQSLFLLLLQRPWHSSRRVLCIHWPTVLYGSKYAARSIARLCVNIPTLFMLKKLYGFKVVWVLHNNYEHDYPHPWIDALGRSLVARMAEGMVAQQAATAKKYAAQYPVARVVYIPHSNYGTFFGPLVQKNTALRQRFGFAPDDIVLLAFGAVRPYKKIEKILEAMRSAGAALSPRIKLWIVGSGDREYIHKLKSISAGMPNIIFDTNFVPDSQVTAYAACADYSVSYFDESEMTSGVVPLSLSCGLPAIVRDIPGAEQVKDGVNGFVFKNVEDLTALLQKLPERAVPTQETVAASIAPYTWDSAVERHIDLWKSLTLDRGL